jgi:pentose-5-phosphate-3-epimerase
MANVVVVSCRVRCRSEYRRLHEANAGLLHSDVMDRTPSVEILLAVGSNKLLCRSDDSSTEMRLGVACAQDCTYF